MHDNAGHAPGESTYYLLRNDSTSQGYINYQESAYLFVKDPLAYYCFEMIIMRRVQTILSSKVAFI